MKFGDFTPKTVDDGNGMSGETSRHLYEFANGYQASVLVTTAAHVAEFPQFYPNGEASIGAYELCVCSQGVPLAMIREFFGINTPDPLGEVPNSVHIDLSEAEVTAMLSRLEAAEALEAA